MTDIQIATTDGTGKILEDATVRAFGAGFRGPLLSPDDGAYDETRKVWNGMIDRRPALIARCAGVADVVAAVSWASTTCRRPKQCARDGKEYYQQIDEAGFTTGNDPRMSARSWARWTI